MTAASAIQFAFVKVATVVAIGLSAVVCLALLARRRWPNLGVRVVTTLAIIVSLSASPALVSVAVGPLQRLGWLVGSDAHPGWAIQWGPAIFGSIVGTLVATAIRRGRRRASAA
jgi:ABC-type enterochelin transport system permease subunit